MLDIELTFDRDCLYSTPSPAAVQRQLDADPARWSMRLVGRGDLQATFAFRGFEEVRRLGLRRATEAAVRAAGPDGEPLAPCPLVSSPVIQKRPVFERTEGMLVGGVTCSAPMRTTVTYVGASAGHGFLPCASSHLACFTTRRRGQQSCMKCHADRASVWAAGPEGDLNTGMLTVDSVVPGGVADGFLQPGDVLVWLSLSLSETLQCAVCGDPCTLLLSDMQPTLPTSRQA